MIPIACLVSVGCSKLSPAQSALKDVNNGNINKSSVPACYLNAAEYILDTKMVSFELTDSGGITAGFSFSGFLKLLGIDLQASSGQMTVGMSLFDPLEQNIDLLDVTGKGVSLKFDASVNAGFSQIGASFDYSHNTPLSTLTQNALDDTFTALTSQMTALQSTWHSTVVSIPTATQFVIPAGSYANIKVGDQFAIYNVDQIWSDPTKPCASQHVMARKTTTAPLAIAQVMSANDLQNNGAVLTLVCSEAAPCDHTETVQLGADVEIQALTDQNRVLFRLMQIRSVLGAQIPYDNNQFVDVSPYLKDQINAIAHNYNFMIYNP